MEGGEKRGSRTDEGGISLNPLEPRRGEKASVTRATGTPSNLSVNSSLITSPVGEVSCVRLIGPGEDKPRGFSSFNRVCKIFFRVAK